MCLSMTETKWVKFGKCHDFVFVGRETVATASGIYVSFSNLNTRERRIERFDSKERGDGASCLAGHPTVPMFSAVERRFNPKISVFMYPTLQRVSKCALPDRVNGYLSCSFAGTEYLLSLTSFPDFKLIVWLWKTGSHVTVLDTKMDNPVQEINCSPNPPHLISHLGLIDGTLSIYQVRTCSKIVNVHHVDVSLPEHKIVSSSWTPEGNLFLCDEFGSVWLVAIESNKLYSVIKSETCKPAKNMPIVVAYKSGMIIANIDSEIKFYTKSSIKWNVSWRFAWSISMAFHSIQAAKRHYFRDGIFFHSKSGEIFEITTQHDNVPRIEVICTDDIEYKMLFSISQRADHVAAVDRLNRLCIFELSTGKLVTRLSLKHHGEVVCTSSHPTLPMFASCSGTGNCIFIDVTSVSSPKIFYCFHLHKDSLDKMRFSNCGEFLAVGNSRIGRIFVIAKRFQQKCINVLGFIEIGWHVADFLIYERNDHRFEILVLATADLSIASVGGNKAILYTCETSTDFHAHAVRMIDLSQPFRTLYHKSNKSLSILGVPTLSKQLHQMEIQNDFQDIVLTEAYSSMHQTRNIGIYATDSRIVTYGYDGLVVIRDSTELRKVIAIFMPHHRSKGGTRFAVLSHSGETIVSLGRNGDVVASRVRLPETKADLVASETVSLHSSMQDFVSGQGTLYNLTEGTWLDDIIAAKLKAEREQALPIRATIVADLKKIKNQMRALVDANESKSLDARLPISAFDLDRESRQRRIEEARLKRNSLRRSLEEECARRDEMSSWLRETFWTPLQLKPCALRSIGGDTTVQNYPLVALTRPGINDPKVWDRLPSDADELAYSHDIYSGSVDERDDSKRASIVVSPDEERSAADGDTRKIPEMAETWYRSVDEAERTCISGVTTHKWIEDESVAWTHQLLVPRVSRLDDILKKDAIIEDRVRKLKIHFNDLFEETRRAKERELKRAKDRIDRLRHCASELKTMFGVDSFFEPIEVPTWHVEEIVDYVVIVEDREIIEKRRSRRGEYEMEMADESREDEERSRSGGDFRATALEKMMDGILEPRWEDEVKKDVPAPECLIAKDPSRYTDEDVAAIALYEFKVRVLQEEREKYKAKLQTEIIETREVLQRDVTAFNEQSRTLEIKKLQVECAILQERLTRIRAIRRHRAEADGLRKIVRLADEEATPAAREARRLAEECGALEVAVLELKARYDGLCKAEKRLESRLRGEFADLKQPMVEHLIRHYKKRPKTGRLVSTSVTYLTEVARCAVSDERSEILPSECLDFLAAVKALDTMPGNLPPQINISRWRTMCRLRRAKIEVETKIKCCAIEMAEAEQTLSFHQKAVRSADNVAACKKADMSDTEKTLARLAEEVEVQLVVRMGQIEIPLQGFPADFANAVLVTREELLRVNDCIVETGKRKLTAMSKSTHLRKVVSRNEWQHSRAKMVLNDLRQELKDVGQFKITRNVLESLSRYPHGVSREEKYEKMESNLRVFENRFRQLLEQEEARVRDIKQLMIKWKKKNDRILKEIESKSSDVEERRGLLDDPRRKRDEELRKMRLAAIARRNRLVTKVEDNYEQLLALHAHLEVLKMRTYPTLRFKTA